MIASNNGSSSSGQCDGSSTVAVRVPEPTVTCVSDLHAPKTAATRGSSPALSRVNVALVATPGPIRKQSSVGVASEIEDDRILERVAEGPGASWVGGTGPSSPGASGRRRPACNGLRPGTRRPANRSRASARRPNPLRTSRCRARPSPRARRRPPPTTTRPKRIFAAGWLPRDERHRQLTESESRTTPFRGDSGQCALGELCARRRAVGRHGRNRRSRAEISVGPARCDRRATPAAPDSGL